MSARRGSQRAACVLVMLLVAPGVGAQDLTEADVERRLAPGSIAALRIDIDVRREPVWWPGQAARRLRADALRALADVAAAQDQVDALEASARPVREIAAALARGEEAGDAAGFDRVQADLGKASLEGLLSDAKASRARARILLASVIGASDPGDGRVRPRTTTPRPDLPAVAVLVDRALALVSGNPARPESDPTPRTPPAGGAPIDGVAAARRADIRATVTMLAAVVAERRSAIDAFRRDGLASAEALVHIAQVSYDNGIRGAADLLDAHRAVAAARLQLADLERAARHAEIDLEELTGEKLP